MDARTYGIGAQRDCREWIEWMLAVTAEAVRVSRGLVLWVAAGVTRDWCYWPGVEGLLYRWWDAGGVCWRPAYWRRVGIPGSGGKQWLRADVEYVLAFAGQAGPIPWADNTAMGHPLKCRPGGAMSNRTVTGERVDGVRQWLRGRRPDGKKIGHEESWMHNAKIYVEVANPGNLIDTGAGGGGNLGSVLAHDNEAPYPEDLAEFFIRSWCPPGGCVLDPFSGSATTAAVAHRLDRHGIGGDLRFSQCELGHRRIAAGMRPVSRLDPAPARDPLPGQLEFPLFSEVSQ